MTSAAPFQPSTPAFIPLDAGDTLTIYSVESLATAWRTKLSRPAPAAANLSAVTTCDSLGIQFLLSARRTVESTGHTLSWSRPSAAVIAAAKAIGCETLFEPSES